MSGGRVGPQRVRARNGREPRGCRRTGMSTRTTRRSCERGNADLAAADLEHQLGTAARSPQEPEYHPHEVAFETAQRFEAGLALGLAALEVGAGPRLPAALRSG